MRPNYLAGQEITGHMRAILIDWLVQVQVKFKLLQETMYMTVAIIDRFLQVRSPSHKSDFPVLGAGQMHQSAYPDIQAPSFLRCFCIC